MKTTRVGEAIAPPLVPPAAVVVVTSVPVMPVKARPKELGAEYGVQFSPDPSHMETDRRFVVCDSSGAVVVAADVQSVGVLMGGNGGIYAERSSVQVIVDV